MAALRQTYLFERAVCAGAKGSNFFTNVNLHAKYQGKNQKVKEGKGSVIMWVIHLFLSSDTKLLPPGFLKQ